MKKSFTVFIFFVFSFFPVLWGQTPEEYVKEGETLLQQKEYKQSIEKLEQAKSAIANLYLEQIKKELFPEKLGAYIPANASSEMVTSYISGNRIQVNRRYSTESNNTNPDHFSESEFNGSVLSITFSNIPEKMYEIASVHAMERGEEGFSEQGTLNPTTFQNYRAVISYDQNIRQGKLAVLIGGAVLEIVAENIDNEKMLRETMEKIPVEKVIKYFGL